MKIFKVVASVFVSLYMWTVMLVFAFWLLVINILKLIFCSKQHVFRSVRRSLKLLFKMLFVKVTVEYDKDLDLNREYVIMPNHVSFFDIPVICSCLPNYTFGIEAEGHFSWPIYGFFIRKYGQLPINRTNVMSSMRTFQKAAENMRQTGASLLVFPEGHRSLDGKLKKINKLPMKAAQTMQVPIVPVGLTGLYDLSPKGGFFLWPSPVKVKYGKPIEVDEYINLKPEQLADVVRQRIIELCDDDIA